MFGIGIKVNLESDGNISIDVKSEPVGQVTGSEKTDFYVYEWYIKKTGEIFYVGKGRKDRYKEFHDNAYEAEKIRATYDTDVRFVKKDLSEIEAVELETQEMTRILNETDYILTNRIVPLDAERGNYYEKSKYTTPLEFETAPVIYADEINYHYFNAREKRFDKVEIGNLKNVCFMDKYIDQEILEIVYSNKFEDYYTEVTELLEKNNCNISSTRYGKSLTAWIYCGEIDINFYTTYQKKLKEITGNNIPTYHLIDVWKYLKDNNKDSNIRSNLEIEINPINNRVPLSECDKPIDVFNEKWDEVDKLYLEGYEQKQLGNYEEAIKLLDEARARGYDCPQLYDTYAMIYRKTKDYDNEIDILNEKLERARIWGNSAVLTDTLDRRRKAYELKNKEIKLKNEIINKAKEKEIKKREKEAKKEQQMKLKRKTEKKTKQIQEGRKILQYDDNGKLIKEYISIAEAVRNTGVNSKSIRDAAKGVQKHAGGYVWKYKD